MKGNIYDNAIIKFTAVLSIDLANDCFREPAGYASQLSALAKMARMLVIQRTVVRADIWEVDSPADLLYNYFSQYVLQFAWDVIYSLLSSDPVPYLPIFGDGIKCTADNENGIPCAYIRRGLEDIQKHCRDQHEWKNTRKEVELRKGGS